MKKLLIRIISLLLVFSLACPVPARAQGLFSLFSDLFSEKESDDVPVTAYADMEYIRPDLEQMQLILEEACRLAEGKDTSAILDGVFAFYDAYDWFYTASALADIQYSIDLSDAYWTEENIFCASAAPAVQQMLDNLNTALAASPGRICWSRSIEAAFSIRQRIRYCCGEHPTCSLNSVLK